MYHFTDDCLIGVEEIDNEHRELFRIINETQDLLDNQIISDKYDRIIAMVERLEHYAEEHFEHEEDYMESIRHPELNLQKRTFSSAIRSTVLPTPFPPTTSSRRFWKTCSAILSPGCTVISSAPIL